VFAGRCSLLRLGATIVDEIKSQLLDSFRTVPKTVVERGRQAVDLIAAVQRFSARFKITWFPYEGRSGLCVIWPDYKTYGGSPGLSTARHP